LRESAKESREMPKPESPNPKTKKPYWEISENYEPLWAKKLAGRFQILQDLKTQKYIWTWDGRDDPVAQEIYDKKSPEEQLIMRFHPEEMILSLPSEEQAWRQRTAELNAKLAATPPAPEVKGTGIQGENRTIRNSTIKRLIIVASIFIILEIIYLLIGWKYGEGNNLGSSRESVGEFEP
jgi:hypothetical protein